MTTQLQAVMLIGIAEYEYAHGYGRFPRSTDDTITLEDAVIHGAKDRRVFASLLKVGFVYRWCSEHFTCVGLTEAGFQAYLKLKGK